MDPQRPEVVEAFVPAPGTPEYALYVKNLSLAARRDAMKNALLVALRTGMPQSKALRMAGIAPTTFKGWRKEDAAFAADLEDATEEGYDNIEAMILKSATDDWRAGARYLEAVRPEKWGRKVDANVNATVAGTVAVEGSISATLKVDLPREAAAWLESIAGPGDAEGEVSPPLQN